MHGKPQDLIGKKIGVQDSNASVFAALLNANGISPDDVEVVPVDFAPQALQPTKRLRNAAQSSAMESLRLVLHILGFSALIGGLLAQAGSAADEKSVNGAMRDGVGTAFLAGIGLAGVVPQVVEDPDYTKSIVKFAVGLVLLILVMATTRKEGILFGLWVGLLVLAVAEVCIAVLWSPVHA